MNDIKWMQPPDDTMDFLKEILNDEFLFDQIIEEKRAYGDYTGQSLRSYVHTELYDYITSNLLYVDWESLASEINGYGQAQPEMYGEWLLGIVMLILVCLVY